MEETLTFPAGHGSRAANPDPCHSRVQRQLDHEMVVDGEVNRETEFRHYELDVEFKDRGKR